jgi:arylsulfatase A-like enzyme
VDWKVASEKGVLAEDLLPALRRANAEPGDAFLLFHTDWRLGMSGPDRLWEEEAGEPGAQSDAFVQRRLQQRNYRYGESVEEQAFANRKRGEMQASMPRVVEALDNFFAAAERERLLGNTTVILTSDHGAMSDKGRIWYGYHPNEEVTRTLLFVHGLDPGVDARLVDTLDLSETIAEYFGVTGFADPAMGGSLLSTSTDAQSYSLTTAAEQFNERFLVIYRGNTKAVFNIALGGAGEASAYEVRDGYREVAVAGGSAVASAYAGSIADALKRYGIQPSDTHPRYRSR